MENTMPQAILKTASKPSQTLMERVRLQGRLALLAVRELAALLALVAGLGLGLIALAEGVATLGL
jgi:hypothetical protein